MSTARLAAGDPAPDFTLTDDTGAEVSLSSLRGRKVVVYFYPAAMTPGCTKQACDFSDSLDSLKASGYEVLGISPDKPEKLAKFRDRSSGLLRRLERISRPRSEWAIDHVAARMFSGLLLVVLGTLLALPIPATNYPFGVILLIFAIALIERDGRLLMIAWLLGLAEIVVLAIFSRQLTEWAGDGLAWLQGLFA